MKRHKLLSIYRQRLLSTREVVMLLPSPCYCWGPRPRQCGDLQEAPRSAPRPRPGWCWRGRAGGCSSTRRRAAAPWRGSRARSCSWRPHTRPVSDVWRCSEATGQFANFWYNASHWHHISQIGLFNFKRHLDQLLLCILTCTSRWLSLKHPLETISCWQHVTLTSCQPCIPQKKFKDTQNS